MKTLLSLIAASAMLSSVAMAEEVKPATTTTESTTPAVSAPAASAPATPAVTKEIHGELKDGTKVEFAADGKVFVTGKDGKKVAAPDGMHTLKDGTTFTVKSGKKAE